MFTKFNCFSGLLLVFFLLISSQGFSKDNFFDLTLTRARIGFDYQDSFKIKSASFSPLVAFKIPFDLKAYLGANLDIGPGILLYGDAGLGKEFKLTDYFSIEPYILIGFGSFYAGSSGHNLMYGIESFCRFNLLLGENVKLFAGLGFNNFILDNTANYEPYHTTTLYSTIPLEFGLTISL